MTRRIVIFLLAALCATAHAQTIRTLGYNSTNGQVVAATNVVWTNAFSFSTNAVAAQVRTNLGLNNTNVYVYAAQAIWDEVNEKVGLQLEDMDFRVADEMVKTNGPTNATNAVRWITVLKGTNIYKLPLYQ